VRTYFIGVGINDFPGHSADLRGCVNDVSQMARRAVERLGAESTLLLDREATVARYEDCVHDHHSMAVEGDRIILDYSMHGSQRLAVGNDQEPDGYDETLCFYPARGSFFKVADDYTDDQHAALIAGFRSGVRVLAIGDLCHSGTFTRELIAYVPQLGDRYQKARYLPPEDTRGGVLNIWRSRLRRRLFRQNPCPPTPGNEGVILTAISGCADAEVSYDAEFNGIYHGAMTKALLEAWDAAHECGDRRPGSDFLLDIQAKLDTWGYPQHPELHVDGGADPTEALFGA
jgi:hypothetical protein